MNNKEIIIKANTPGSPSVSRRALWAGAGPRGERRDTRLPCIL